MATELAAPASAVASTGGRRLVLVWQDPATRGFVRVGHLDKLAGGRFASPTTAARRPTVSSRLRNSPLSTGPT